VEGVLWGRRAASIRTRHGQGGLPRGENSCLDDNADDSVDAGNIASHDWGSAAVATADAADMVSYALGGDGGGGGEGAARRGLKAGRNTINPPWNGRDRCALRKNFLWIIFVGPMDADGGGGRR
jgi:hypothetical protein